MHTDLKTDEPDAWFLYNETRVQVAADAHGRTLLRGFWLEPTGHVIRNQPFYTLGYAS